MSRRLPLCATCGRSLALPGYRGASARLRWDGVPGCPEVGWCEEHLDELVTAQGLADVEARIKEIAARGAGRVVRNTTSRRKP